MPRPAFDPEVFRSRFLGVRRDAWLEDQVRDRRERILSDHPELRHAWRLYQHLHRNYTAEGEERANAALGESQSVLPVIGSREIRGADTSTFLFESPPFPPLNVAQRPRVAAGRRPYSGSVTGCMPGTKVVSLVRSSRPGRGRSVRPRPSPSFTTRTITNPITAAPLAA